MAWFERRYDWLYVESLLSLSYNEPSETRFKGAGTAQLAAILESALRCGLKGIKLDSSRDSLGFYLKLGLKQLLGSPVGFKADVSCLPQLVTRTQLVPESILYLSSNNARPEYI